ncbi:MAG: glutathione S-transferase family protein [Cyanobacteria bacterium P01_C01_bin.72]
MKLKSWGLCLTIAISIALPKIVQAQEIEPQNIKATNSQSSLILYGGKRSRSQVVAWYLEELGIAYQDKKLDLGAGDNKQPEYLAINPMGKVPALVDGDFNIWESGAILWYLANKYGEMSSDLTVQSETMQWILFANSTLANGLFIEDRQEQEIPRLLTPLNQILQDSSYIMGEDFTVADVAISFYLYAAKIRFNLEWQEYPFIVDYLERLTQREAFANTIGQR